MKRSLSSATTTTTLWQELPPEMWVEILSHLRKDQLHICATVCMAWGRECGFVNQSITTAICLPTKYITRVARWRNLEKLTVFGTSSTYHLCLVRWLYPVLPNLCNLTSLDMRQLDTTQYYISPEKVNLMRTLTNLKSLRLKYADATDGLVIRCLTGLVELTVKNMRIVVPERGCVVDDDLCGLRHLTRLVLKKSDAITDGCLATLTTLRRLRLYGNKLITVASLKQLTGLTRLSICGYAMPSPVDMFEPLTRLETLKLDATDEMHDAHLKYLTGLRSLTLKPMESITPAGICALSQLTRLITNGGVDVLSYAHQLTGLQSLEFMPMIGSPAVGNGYLSLYTGLSSLKMFCNTCVNTSIRLLTRLTELHLTGDHVMTLDDYASLPISLRTLSLAYSHRFKEESVYDTMLRLTNLTHLQLCKRTLGFIQSGVFQQIAPTLRTIGLPQPDSLTKWHELKRATTSLIPTNVEILYKRH